MEQLLERVLGLLLAHGGIRTERALGKIDALKLRGQRCELLGGFGVLGRTVDILDLAVDDVFHHTVDGRGKVLSVEHLLALLIDDAALGVHDVIVLQNIFTDLEIAAFDGFLGVFDCAGEHFRVDGRVLVDAEAVHHAHHALRAEQTHDVVLQRQEEPRFAGVALTAGTAA